MVAEGEITATVGQIVKKDCEIAAAVWQLRILVIFCDFFFVLCVNILFNILNGVFYLFIYLKKT